MHQNSLGSAGHTEPWGIPDTTAEDSEHALFVYDQIDSGRSILGRSCRHPMSLILASSAWCGTEWNAFCRSKRTAHISWLLSISHSQWSVI